MKKKSSDAADYVEGLKKKLCAESRTLGQLTRKLNNDEIIVNQYKERIQKIRNQIETLEVDLLTSAHKASLNQAEYDRQKKLVDEIQEAINNNHRDFLLENYSDIF